MELRERVERAEAAVVLARARVDALARDAANAARFSGGRRVAASVAIAAMLGLVVGIVVHNGAPQPALRAPGTSDAALEACQEDVRLYHRAWNDCRREQQDLGIACQCPDDAPRCGCTP